MKKIIAVKGKAAVGKSTAIKETFEWIKDNYVFKPILPNKWRGDIKTIIEVEGFVIGICSAGDEGKTVKEYLNEFEDANCEIILCACRTRGKTFQIVNQYRSKGYSLEFVNVKEISNSTFPKIKRRIYGLPKETEDVRVFSYGSNMLFSRIKERANSAKVYSKGFIKGHSLRFHKISKRDGSGKADIFYTGNEQDIVWGIIICISKADKKILDGFEGLGYGYEEKSILVTLPDNDKMKATAYVAKSESIDEKLKPFDWYYNFVLEGAKENQLPENYIKLVEKIDYVVDKDESRRNENIQILEKTRR